jgi:hypothetical protein
VTVTPARRTGAILALVAFALLGGCSMPEQIQQRSPAEVRAQLVRLLPPGTPERKGWATDIYAAFAALDIEPTTQNLCATLAVTEQESGFTTNPVVPGLAKIARDEIYRRAEGHGIPSLIVHGALVFSSHDGKSYDEQLATVRTEQDLSRIYEEFIGSVPLGRRLLAGDNPVHTAGPMQVSVAFAEQYARVQPYPYPVTGSIRHEVFTRRGGMYFGIAHLLGYPAEYALPLYRFADFNAGWYASRNAAFQQAVSLASGIPIALDGDLVRYDAKRGANPVGATEVAVRSLARSLDLSDGQIHRALQQGESAGFDRSTLYERVFALAEQRERRPLPRAVVPRIHLASPKITRMLTTDWYASRVDQRYRRCMAKAAAG